VKSNKLISEKDILGLSDSAFFMIKNLGYYFWDKKANKEVCKYEIHNTFKENELKNIYAGIHKRYERREK